jgi:hypothetical protein
MIVRGEFIVARHEDLGDAAHPAGRSCRGGAAAGRFFGDGKGFGLLHEFGRIGPLSMSRNTGMASLTP